MNGKTSSYHLSVAHVQSEESNSERLMNAEMEWG